MGLAHTVPGVGVLLAVSVWIRLKLNELPVFERMVEEGKQSKRPLTEAFGQWSNAKIAILALFGATAGKPSFGMADSSTRCSS